MKIAAALLALSFATPATAGPQFTLTNGLTATITGVNTYPVGDDGTVIDDNIGGFFEPPLLPGSSMTFELASTTCETVMLYIRIEGRSGDFATAVDLCKVSAITLR